MSDSHDAGERPFAQDDPFVAEVRAARAAIWAEVGGNLDALYERVRAVEAAQRAAGREFVPIPESGALPPAADAA